MDDAISDPFRPLVRLGWIWAVLGALQPIGLILELSQSGRSEILYFWLPGACLAALPALNAGILLIRRSSRALVWAGISGAAILVNASGPLFLLYRTARPLDQIQSTPHLIPHFAVQLLLLLFSLYFVQVTLSSRWHQGVLGSKLGGDSLTPRIAFGISLGCASILQLAWYRLILM